MQILNKKITSEVKKNIVKRLQEIDNQIYIAQENRLLDKRN